MKKLSSFSWKMGESSAATMVGWSLENDAQGILDATEYVVYDQ